MASHILFEIRARPKEEAQKLALEAQAKLAAGEDFNKLAREISDDRSARNNFGKLDWFGRGEMDPDFEKAAFALKNVGDLAGPGVLVVRLAPDQARGTPARAAAAVRGGA